MDTTKALALALLVGAVAFFSGWNLKPDRAERAGDRDARGESGRAVTLAEHEAVQRQLKERSARLDLVQRELEQIQRESYEAARAAEAEDAAEGEARLKGPRFVYGGTVEGLNAVDWDAVGTAMSGMTPVIEQFVAGLEEGKSIEELGELIGEIQQLNGPLLGEAFKLSRSESFAGTGVNGAFTHPAVMVNMIHAALTKADQPLSEEQERALYEIGLRFTEEERARRAGYGNDAFGIQKLVDETGLKDRFFAEVFGVLGEDQGQRLRPEATRGLTRLDIFDSALVFSQVARPVDFGDRASLTTKASSLVMNRLQLDAAHKPAVEAAVRGWADAMPDEFLNAPAPVKGPIPIHRRERLAELARRQAQLFAELARTVPLTEAQLETLRDEVAVIVPRKSG